MRLKKIATAADSTHQTLVETDLGYQTAPVGLCVMDRDLRFVRVNDRMAAINGCPVEDHAGKTLRDIVPHIADRVERLYRQVLTNGEPVLSVKIVGAPNAETGQIKHWLSNFYPIKNEAGEAIGISTVVQEVTDLEAARQSSEERLKTERLVSEVSTGFLNLPAEQVDGEIERRLGQVAAFLSLDRASLMEYHDRFPHLSVTHTWSASGIRPIPDRLPLASIPWSFARVLSGEVMHFSSLDELPADAAPDREFYRAAGVCSGVAIPLTVAGAKLGVVTFASLTQEQHWSKDLLRRLRLIGEIFASALIRKRAEEDLSRSENRYREVIEDQEEYIVRWTPDTRRTFVNDAYCRVFGQSRQQLIGTSFMSLVAEEERETVAQKIRRLTRENPAETDEHRVVLPDGRSRWQMWTDRGIFDEHGRLIEVQSVGRDITERRLADEALRVSEQRYRILVENAPEAIVVFDVDSERFTDVNENAVRLFKQDRERLLRASPARISPPTQPDGQPSEEAARKFVALALAGEKPIFEWLHRDADGRDIPTEVRLVRLPAAEGKRLVRGSVTDITERKRLEQELRQAQKMEAVGQLAGGIAHDFNNLLTAIQGNAELALAEHGPLHPCRTELRAIQAASERAGALTGQLLAFSRKQSVRPRIISVNVLIEHLSHMLRRLIGEDIRLVIRLSASRHHVKADPGQLEQALVNLVVNARDAMPRGGTLTIATKDLTLDARDRERPLAPGRHVVVRVSDTGAGIAPELQARIFEPFFTTKERGKGTGLGLSMVYGVVAQNRGTIRVDSEPGRGTTFEIYLACTDERPDRDAGPHEPAVRGNETILLVEDEEIVRDLVLRGLTNYGYSVIEAANAKEALRLCAEHPGEIDMLVTDVIMPGMSGAELAERVYQRRRDIEVLFISGYTDDLIRERGAFGGSAALLEKPFTPEELARRVRQLLDRHGPTGKEPRPPA